MVESSRRCRDSNVGRTGIALLATALPVCAQDHASTIGEEDAFGVPFAMRCLDENGLPIVGAGLICGPRHELTTKRALDAPIARSDHDGWLRCTLRVPEPSHALLVAAPGHASRVQFAQPLPMYRNVIRFARGTIAKGRVHTVRDGRKVPIANARIEIFDMLRADFMHRHTRFSSAGTTNAQGRFELAGALKRGVHVAVDAPGFYRRLFVAPDVTKTIDCTLEPSGSYRGRVVAPPSVSKDWTIEAVGQNSSDARRYPLKRAGAFEIPILDSTPTWLVVRDRGVVVASKSVDPVRGADLLRTPIYIEADIEGDRVLDIRVRDLATFEPIHDYRVTTTWNDRTATAQRLLLNLTPRPRCFHENGRSRVFLLRDRGGAMHIDAPGYEYRSIRFDDVERDEELVVDLTPEPASARRAAARIRDASKADGRDAKQDGMLFAGHVRGLPPGVDHVLRIAKNANHGYLGHRIEIAADGSFHKNIDVKLPVHVYLEISRRPRHGAARVVELGKIESEAAASSLEHRVTTSATLVGRVDLAPFAAHFHRFLVLSVPRHGHSVWAWVDRDGSFRLHVADGKVTLSLHDACSGQQLHACEYDVRRGRDNEILLEPKFAAVDLTLRVRNAFGLRLGQIAMRDPNSEWTWMRNGLDLPGCAPELRLFLPTGTAEISIADGWQVTRDGVRGRKGDGNVLQRVALDVATGNVHSLTIDD
ncbi:MAG: carboxypeptidase regulatory-like domain-containing protein [Planctomycetes bacterium]|nr:carboxypeptidase regulatory-like domain-containing protein [Planctomycetota bacterium]